MTTQPATPKLVPLRPSERGPASPELVTSRPSEGETRRDFLKSSGALVICFSATSLEPFALEQGRGGGAQRSQVDAKLLDSWIGVAADGSVFAHTGKCELGQGIQTAQTQLIAEELSVAVDRVKLVMCDTSICPDQGTTSGSQSHPTNFNHANLALACATAREALIDLAATRLGVPRDQITVDRGVARARTDPQKNVTYAELVGGKAFSIPVNPSAKRKDPREWTVLGKPVARVDMPAMVTGQLEYVHNVRVPGMVHGAAVRPPEVGAALKDVDEASVRSLPGFIKVVVRKNFVGVVAEKPWQAMRAAAALKAEWSAGSALPPQAGFYDYLRKQPSRDTLVVDSRDVDDTLARAATVGKAT